MKRHIFDMREHILAVTEKYRINNCIFAAKREQNKT